MSRSWKIAVLALIGVALGLVAAQAFIIAQHSQKNSDTVLNYLESLDMVSGNISLSGWHVPKHSYFLTDTLPAYVYAVVMGSSSLALDVLPTLTLLLLAAAAGALAAPKTLSRSARSACFVGVFLLVSLIPDLKQISLLPSNHVGGVLLALFMFCMVARCARRAEVNVGLVGPFLIALCLVFNDQFGIVYGVAPILGALVIQAVFRKSRIAIVLALLVALGCMAGMVLPSIIERFGGFSARSDLLLSFASPAQMMANAKSVLYGLAQIAGGNPFTQIHDAWSAIGVIARLCVLASSVVAFAAFVYRSATAPSTAGLMDLTLACVVMCIALSAVTSSMFSLALAGAAPHDAAGAIRYLFPGWVCLIVLASRQAGSIGPNFAKRRDFALVGGLLFSLLVVAHTRFVLSISDQPCWKQTSVLRPVVDWLHSRRLTHGGGEYWASHMATVVSDNRITVLPLAPYGSKLGLMKNLVNDRWDVSRPQFVVWPKGSEADRAAVQTYIVATYGRPAEMATVGLYDIAVFDGK